MRFTVSTAPCIFEYRGRTFMVMTNSAAPSTGSAMKKTTARVWLMEYAIPVAATSITGPRQKGRIPMETAFWIFVTSLVRRVTRDEVRK